MQLALEIAVLLAVPAGLGIWLDLRAGQREVAKQHMLQRSLAKPAYIIPNQATAEAGASRTPQACPATADLVID